MKATHVLIGAGIAVAAIFLAKKYLAPGSSSGAQDPAKPSVGGNVDNVVNGVRGLFDGIKSVFVGGKAPAAPPKESPVPGVNFDIDADQNGQYATNVIQFRAEA